MNRDGDNDNPVSGGTAAPPGKKRQPFDVVGFVLRRGVLIGLLGTLAGLALGLALYSLGDPVYRTAAVLLVDPAKQPTVSGRDRESVPGNLRDWIRTQLSRIRAKDVMLGAIERVPLEDRPDFLRERPDHPANPFRLMKRLDAREQTGTYLIELSLENDDPDGLAEVLNAVVDTFLQKLRRETEEAYQSRLEYLRLEREKISARLAEEEKRIMALAEGVDNKAFLHEGYNAHLTRVDQIQRLYWEAFDREVQARSTLRKVEADRDAVLQMSLQAYADERVADNFGINRIEQWTYEQLQRMRASIDGLTETNEDRVYVETRMEAMNRYLAEYKQRVGDETISNLREKRKYEFDRQVQLARTAAEAAERAAEILRGRLEDARGKASEISLAIFQASSPSLARDQLRERLQALSDRIDDAEMLAKAPVPVQIDQRAESPASPSSTSHVKLGLAGFVVGFGAVGAMILLYELMDDRIRSTRDLRMALAGDVPEALPQVNGGEGPGFGRLMLDQPGHPAVGVVRDVAGRLSQDRARHRGQVYVVAGVHPGAGATAFALQLARALRAMEDPVLLMEWNLSRPGLRGQAELPPGDGIEVFLRGEKTWEDVVQRDEGGQVDLVVSEGGPRPPQVTGLRELATSMREDYAMVVIDVGPLTGDLARMACRQADGVILVTAWKQGRYHQLRQAYERVALMGVPAVTAVLNRAPKSEEHPVRELIIQGTNLLSGIADRILFFRRTPHG